MSKRSLSSALHTLLYPFFVELTQVRQLRRLALEARQQIHQLNQIQQHAQHGYGILKSWHAQIHRLAHFSVGPVATHAQC